MLAATYRAWRDDRTIRLGAGLAYYGLFSLTSLLTVSVGLIQLFTSRAVTEEYLSDHFSRWLGTDSADLAATFSDALNGSRGTRVGLVGLASLLVTGSLFFLALEDAFNQIWGVPVAAGIRSSIRRRLTAFGILIAAAATLVAAVLAQTVTSVLGGLLPGSNSGWNLIDGAVTNGVGLLILSTALICLLRYLPSAEVSWLAAIISGAITAGLLIVGTSLIAWYLRTVGAGSLGGAAAGVIAVLMFIFYESQILLGGAQLCRAIDIDRLSDVDQLRVDGRLGLMFGDRVAVQQRHRDGDEGDPQSEDERDQTGEGPERQSADDDQQQ